MCLAVVLLQALPSLRSMWHSCVTGRGACLGLLLLSLGLFAVALGLRQLIHFLPSILLPAPSGLRHTGAKTR